MTEADTDGLARLANRKSFDVALERALTIASVVKRPVTLFRVDVEDVPSIDDQLDEKLNAIADTLAHAFPRPSGLVARYGGEELAILLRDRGEAEVALLADRLLGAVRGLGYRVSAGAAVAGENETGAELVERAQQALHRSKRAGRNRWCAAPSRVH